MLYKVVGDLMIFYAGAEGIYNKTPIWILQMKIYSYSTLI
jgi:hypothetical protein